LGAVFPHFCPDKRESWHGERTRLSGQRVPLRGEKPIFGPLSKNNTGMAALRAGLPAIKRHIGRKHQFFVLRVFNLHDPIRPLRSFAQNFNTNCRVPELLGGADCRNIAEKFKSLPIGSTITQTDDKRQTDSSCHKPNVI